MARLALDKALKKCGVTRYRLAILLRADRQNLAKYFKPGANPTLYTLNRIAKALKCRVRDLLEE